LNNSYTKDKHHKCKTHVSRKKEWTKTKDMLVPGKG